MIGKLFKTKKAPTNGGDQINQSQNPNIRLKKVYELELVNMEGRPCYRLTSKLGFGSQLGEVIIADESISPRHCTFTLEQDVITLIDHNSLRGTKVNNSSIEAGKKLILDENDEVQIGELLIRIKSFDEPVSKGRKASLASIPDRAEEPLESEEEIDERDYMMENELIAQLTKLDDKFTDGVKLHVQENDNETSSYISIKHLDELVKSAKEAMEPSFLKESDEISIDDLLEMEYEEDEDIEEEEDVKEVDNKKNAKDEKTNPKKGSATSAFKKIFSWIRFGNRGQSSFRQRSQNIVLVKKYAANTVLRIVALHIDICFAYGTYLLLSPFDDFQNLLAQTTALGKELFAFISNNAFYQKNYNNFSFLLEMGRDLWTFIDTYINPLPALMIVVISKLVFTAIFGVSLGQLSVGMKSEGNLIWKRVGGVLRTLVGFVTFPFLIFDVGAIVSRRTFKEVITFTRLYSDSKLANIFSSTAFVIISGIYVLMAPMFQGFETIPSYQIAKEVEERVRLQDSEELVEETPQIFSSSFLGFKAELSEDFEVLPGFKFEGTGNKTNSHFLLNIYDRKMEGNSQIEILKTFDLKQLLEIGFKGNPFLKLKFPHVDNYINQYTPVGFKRSVLNSDSFTEEFMDFHRMAMDMNILSYFNYFYEVPLVNSLLSYKQSFLSLFDGIDFSEMSFIKIGNMTALKISGNNADYLMPILPEGKIIKVSFKGENASGLGSRLYRYALYKSNWTQEIQSTAFDRILIALSKGQEVSLEDAQAIYAFYYELSQKILSRSEEEEYLVLKRSVQSVQLLINSVTKDGSSALMKLQSNFTDLVDAVEIRNLEYFNLTKTTIL